MIKPLESADRSELIGKIPNWRIIKDRDALFRSFHFNDFEQAFKFMNQCSSIAVEMNHHPEWLNIWNKVDVTLTTHSANGITRLDVSMAQQMDEVFLLYRDGLEDI